MLENLNESSTAPTIKRYAPPNQRNRSLTKRKSAGGGIDKFERMINNYGIEGEKNVSSASKNASSEYGSNNLHSRLIPLQGCSRSEAAQLLSDRWKVAMNALNDPSIDLADRPVMYSGSTASAWGSFKLPHQLMSPTNMGSSGTRSDFLGELRRAINDANTRGNP